MTTDIDWVAIAARDNGDPRNPALLLLHGFTGSGSVWAGLAAGLRRRGVRTIAPDLPGHGRAGVPTEPASATVEWTADDLARLLGRLDATPASVLGYSLGARVALRLTIAHPAVVSRLVLESPSAGIADEAAREERRRADDQLADEIERGGIEAFVDRWERDPIFASHAKLDARVARVQRELRLRNTAAGLALSLRSAGQGAMHPLHDRLAEIHAPTLVIAGALDPARARAELVAAGIPGARLAIVAGAGHTPHLERPAAFRRLALEFLMEDAAA
jgi:2-succinyl-6-hydroxy-2,4-cyclohexadiene-1-carboxylate synthase